MRETLAKLKGEALPRVILVYGPEAFWHERIFSILQNRYAEDPLSEWNWSVFRGEKEFELEPLLAELGMLPWGDAKKTIVLKEGDLLPAATMEELARWLEVNEDTNTLVLFFTKFDERLKYSRILEKLAWKIYCQHLEGEALVRYVMDYCLERGRKMGRATAQLFLERAGTNLSFIHQELAKILIWSEGEEEITQEAVEAVSSLFPSQIANYAVFQMTDFIAQKKRGEALAVLDLLLTSGEIPLRILPLIERQLRLLLAVKTGEGRPKIIASQMGETSDYGLRKLQRYKGNFSLDEIFAGFAAVIKADRELKLGSPGNQVLTDLIIKLTA